MARLCFYTCVAIFQWKTAELVKFSLSVSRRIEFLEHSIALLTKGGDPSDGLFPSWMYRTRFSCPPSRDWTMERPTVVNFSTAQLSGGSTGATRELTNNRAAETIPTNQLSYFLGITWQRFIPNNSNMLPLILKTAENNKFTIQCSEKIFL